MATNTTDDVVTGLRDAMAIRAPKPTREFREKAWRLFEQALDRHLARHRATPRVTQRLH